MSSDIKTSDTHPIQIGFIDLACGRVGLTFCPGKHQDSGVTGNRWRRDLDTDLARVRSNGFTHVISLIEWDEMVELSVPNLGERVAAHGMTWSHFPIVDGDTPTQASLPRLRSLRHAWQGWLAADSSVLVHCKGGLGRAGTIASILLLDAGHTDDAEAAMRAVRAVRPGAIENRNQERFVRDLARNDRETELPPTPGHRRKGSSGDEKRHP